MPLHRPRLLVVDDDQEFLSQIGTIAHDEGFDVATSADVKEARRYLRQRPAELVLLTVRQFGLKPGQFLCNVRDLQARGRVALVSDHASPDVAVEAVRQGAFDCLPKPVDAVRARALLAAVRADVDRRRAVVALERELAQRLECCGMVGRGVAMGETFDLLRRLAPHARIALLTGEPGTGKNLAAQALHQLGPRNANPLVTVNCAAAIEVLLDSELFGHVAGAFSGASDDRAGVFETADGGTIVLDEIAELPPALQEKLVAVLDTGVVRRAGSLEQRRVDVGLVATTAHDLARDVGAGRFRADLYRSLSVAEVHLPPLRERLEDVPFLTASMIRAFSERFARPVAGLTAAAERYLASASWPGNVRQLRTVLERACALADSEFITEAELAAVMTEQEIASERVGADRVLPGSPAECRAMPLLEVERDHIVRTLDQVRGNKAVAARRLGISRRAFYRQLERHGLHTPAAAGSRATCLASVSQERHS